MAFRNKSVDVHRFSMIPRADIPRSSFKMEKAYKTSFDAGWLIPVFAEEVLPGDTFNLRMTALGRLATPIVPVMDNLYLDTFFFFVPNRLVWDNWERFMGAQDDPDDSISYVIPQVVSPVGGFPVGSIYDYLGLPTVGQVDPAGSISVNALYTRAYNLIWNEWFRDENLQDSIPVDKDDGPDTVTDYQLQRRGKRKDYFTGALPWPQKGNTSVSLPLGTTAPVVGNGNALGLWDGGAGFLGLTSNGAGSGQMFVGRTTAYGEPIGSAAGAGATNGPDLAIGVFPRLQDIGGGVYFAEESGLVADLSTATAATINQLRQAFQIQKLLERDARGGTRYTEIVRAHFGVVSPDARLQRPEYLGGGSQRINISPIAQTSETADTPQGNLAAMGSVVASGHGFTQSFTEHGMVLGLAMIRADLTYQQGLRRMWSRSTRYDYYFPAFAMLGEQAILRKEIYARGVAGDNTVFGYQERWAEYRYNPSQITGLFRSTSAGTIDNWHLAQEFSGAPVLGETFIVENPPLERVLAVGAEANGQQMLLDCFFSIRAARPLPMYSVPGLIDHF